MNINNQHDNHHNNHQPLFNFMNAWSQSFPCICFLQHYCKLNQIHSYGFYSSYHRSYLFGPAIRDRIEQIFLRRPNSLLHASDHLNWLSISPSHSWCKFYASSNIVYISPTTFLVLLHIHLLQIGVFFFGRRRRDLFEICMRTQINYEVGR